MTALNCAGSSFAGLRNGTVDHQRTYSPVMKHGWLENEPFIQMIFLLRPPFSSGIFQPAMFDYQRVSSGTLSGHISGLSNPNSEISIHFLDLMICLHSIWPICWHVRHFRHLIWHSNWPCDMVLRSSKPCRNWSLLVGGGITPNGRANGQQVNLASDELCPLAI